MPASLAGGCGTYARTAGVHQGGAGGWMAGRRAGVDKMLYGDNHSSIFSLFHNLWCFHQDCGVGNF